jgi:hypothetical protein
MKLCLSKCWHVFLWLILYFSIGASLVVAIERWEVETGNNTVSVALDISSATHLAEIARTTESTLLASMKDDEIISSLFVSDTGLVPLLSITSGEVLNCLLPSLVKPSQRRMVRDLIRPDSHYVLLPANLNVERTIVTLVSNEYENAKVIYTSSTIWIAEIPAAKNSTNQRAVLPVNDFSTIRNLGLDVYLGIRNWTATERKDIEDYSNLFRKIPHLSGVVFIGSSIPGDSAYVSEWKASFASSRLKVGLVDFPGSRAGAQLVSSNPDAGFRAYFCYLDPTALNKGDQRTFELIVEPIFTRIRDHNVRLVVFAINSGELDETSVRNLQLLLRLTKQRIEDGGYRLGKVEAFKPLRPSKWLLFLVSLAAVASSTLLTRELIRKEGCSVFVFIILFLLSLGVFSPKNVTSLQQFLALVTAVSFTSLSLIRFSPRKEGSTWPRAVSQVLLMSAFSMAGGIATSSLLAGNSFLLHAEQFRGVKLLYVSPLLIFGLHLANELYGRLSLAGVMHKLSNVTLGIKDVILAFFAFVAFGYYLLRSGNTRVYITYLEIKIRFLLGKYLIIRPRTKEFLLGHPSMIYAQKHGLNSPQAALLALLGAAGQVSIVDSFAHIYTPLWVSIVRTLIGVVLGILVSLAMLIVESFILSRTIHWGK